MESSSRDKELFFKCPKCGSVYSTRKSALEQDRYTKASLTRVLLGGKISPLASVPKCTRCSSKLDQISAGRTDAFPSNPTPSCMKVIPTKASPTGPRATSLF